MFRPNSSSLRLIVSGAAVLAVSAASVTFPVQASPDTDGRSGAAAKAQQTYRVDARDIGNVVKLDLLAINDFHGNLEPITAESSSGRINNTPAGGAEYLATHLKRLRDKSRANGARSRTVAAGDLVGASPLLSAAFHDEPTIRALNRMRLDVAAVGNHEFDEGYKELRRLQHGGCLDDGAGADNQDSCPDGEPFPGARFQYLAANVIKNRTGRSVLRSVEVTKVGGIKVAFIGMTLRGTAGIVSQDGIRGLTFKDEARTANALVPRLRDHGVESIVVLLHEGGFTTDSSVYDACPGITGPIVDINDRLSPRIDAIISGHTHQPYNCSLPDKKGTPRLLTSASSFGRLVTNVHLLLDRKDKDVVRPAAYAQNGIVTRDIPIDATGITRLIDRYSELVGEIANAVIGQVTQTITRDQDASAESPLGLLIADSQRQFSGATAPGDDPPADIAFMNPGGIRADLVPEPDGDVTYGAAFTVQPFSNYVDTMDLTGEQVLEVLRQQFSGDNAASPRVLQPSGLTYTWGQSETGAAKVVESSVEVGGEPIDRSATYRVAVNSFLSDGGDGFSIFTDGTNKYRGGIDLDALAEYLGDNSPYAPLLTNRIDVQP